MKNQRQKPLALRCPQAGNAKNRWRSVARKRATPKIVGVALPASGQRQKSLVLRCPGNGQCTGNGQRIRKNRFYFLYLNSFFSRYTARERFRLSGPLMNISWKYQYRRSIWHVDSESEIRFRTEAPANRFIGQISGCSLTVLFDPSIDAESSGFLWLS